MMGCRSKILPAQGDKVHSHNGASASHKFVHPHPVQGNIILPDEALSASTACVIGLPKQPHPSSNHVYMKPRCSSNRAGYTVQPNELSVFTRSDLSKEKDQSDHGIF